MTKKVDFTHPQPDRIYEKILIKEITRRLHTSHDHASARIYLNNLLLKFGYKRGEGIFAPNVKTWIEYLLTHTQAIYYYRKIAKL